MIDIVSTADDANLPEMGKLPNRGGVSILILTKNEQDDLPGCLASVSWSDDVHVYDSGSTDRTGQIALEAGAHLSLRVPENGLPFGGDEAEHRNWGLRNIPFKYNWVFVLDADERVTSDLAAEIMSVASSSTPHSAFRVRRRDFMGATWLRHVQATPYYVRLLMPSRVYHERIINTVAHVNGSVGVLRGFLDHFPFSKGAAHWLSRHNTYSSFEARQIYCAKIRGGQEFSVRAAFFERDVGKRRFHQKELFYRAPCRPLVKFFILYVLKLGLLDGRAGLTYAILQSIYEYFIVLKVRELEAADQRSLKFNGVDL